MLSDAELVRVAQSGDASSLGVLLERYRAPLYGLALQILGRRPEAQDAVHDAFLVALRKIDQVHEPAAVGGWLYTVLRNVCRMRLREGQGEILLDELPRHIDQRISEPSTEESVDRLAMRDWVWTALSELTEALRVTAMLRYFGSYASYEEISTILGVPVGTVRSRLNQVKVKLADALLETAGLAHGDARRLTESRTRYFAAAMEEISRGKGYDAFADAFAEDPELVLSNGKVLRGRRHLIEDLEGDLTAGTKMHLTDVIAGKDVTIVETDFGNPPEDPFRCPPATTQVHFQRGGETQRVHLYFAPRPQGKEVPIESPRF